MNAADICALIDFTTIAEIGPAALDHAVRGMLPEHDEIEPSLSSKNAAISLTLATGRIGFASMNYLSIVISRERTYGKLVFFGSERLNRNL